MLWDVTKCAESPTLYQFGIPLDDSHLMKLSKFDSSVGFSLQMRVKS